jgi:hypothetical protein
LEGKSSDEILKESDGIIEQLNLDGIDLSPIEEIKNVIELDDTKQNISNNNQID